MMVDGEYVRHIGPQFKGILQPQRLFALNRIGMVGIKEHYGQVVAEIQCPIPWLTRKCKEIIIIGCNSQSCTVSLTIRNSGDSFTVVPVPPSYLVIPDTH